jgi:predicted ATPase
VSGFTLNVENVQTVAQICQRLDGLPWAIELAAAQLNWLSIRQLNQQLDQSVETLFALLSEGWRNELPHHQTLTALVDWSYQRLNEKEQNLFLRLVLLNGNWTVETAEKVWREAYKTGHNPIQRGEGEEVEATSVPGLVRNLITKSLVVAEKAGWENTDKNGECSLCYRILETIRQFGLKKQRVN